MPRCDIVLRPSTYHHSPSASDTTWGIRSPSSVPRPVQRSGGSTMCESDEIIHVRASTSVTSFVSTNVMCRPPRVVWTFWRTVGAWCISRGPKADRVAHRYREARDDRPGEERVGEVAGHDAVGDDHRHHRRADRPADLARHVRHAGGDADVRG